MQGTSLAVAGKLETDQNLTLTATIIGERTPTGTVTFNAGDTVLGTAAVTEGKASLVTKFTSAGARTFTATYSGNKANRASVSTPVEVRVELDPQKLAALMVIIQQVLLD